MMIFKDSFLAKTLATALVCFAATQLAHAGSLEQAKRIHDRLAGVPPEESVLLAMKADIDAGDMMAAAERAMENDGFYNVTLKNWVAPWTNRDFDGFTALNDYMATVIGIVRDSDIIDYREVLYGDHLYVGDDSLGLPAHANDSNAHYAALEDQNISLKDNLVYRSQAAVTGLPADATSGVITSRAAAKAFFIAGTNRAQFRFALINHLCMDLEQVHDVTRVPDRIRQDVSRSPGGDSRVFLNTCVGCHNGMDPLTQAFAYYDYVHAEEDTLGENGQINYNTTDDPDRAMEEGIDGRVQEKYFNNDNTFVPGYRTPNDTWVNYWREGQNSVLGWDASLPGSGSGARSMMQELAHSEAFAACAVQKVFKTVCLRDAQSQDDLTQLADMQANFVNGAHNIKNVFAESAIYCAGE